MSALKVTLRGFYNYLQYSNEDLFKNLNIPESPLIDKNTLITNILQKSDDMESLYTDPYYIQESITYWSLRWYRTFQKWIDALNKTYEPLYNVDMHQDTIDKTTTDRDETIDDTLTSERDIKDHETSDTDEDVSYSESNTISAFNAETLRNDTAKTSTTNTDADYTRNTTTDDDLSSTQKNVQAEDTVVDYLHNDHWFGRDHVAAQDLLEKELKVAAWNIYDHITDIFLQEFCIMVY